VRGPRVPQPGPRVPRAGPLVFRSRAPLDPQPAATASRLRPDPHFEAGPPFSAAGPPPCSAAPVFRMGASVFRSRAGPRVPKPQVWSRAPQHRPHAPQPDSRGPQSGPRVQQSGHVFRNMAHHQTPTTSRPSSVFRGLPPHVPQARPPCPTTSHSCFATAPLCFAPSFHSHFLRIPHPSPHVVFLKATPRVPQPALFVPLPGPSISQPARVVCNPPLVFRMRGPCAPHRNRLGLRAPQPCPVFRNRPSMRGCWNEAAGTRWCSRKKGARAKMGIGAASSGVLRNARALLAAERAARLRNTGRACETRVHRLQTTDAGYGTQGPGDGTRGARLRNKTAPPRNTRAQLRNMRARPRNPGARLPSMQGGIWRGSRAEQKKLGSRVPHPFPQQAACSATRPRTLARCLLSDPF
jgi:hypothetical protein